MYSHLGVKVLSCPVFFSGIREQGKGLDGIKFYCESKGVNREKSEVEVNALFLISYRIRWRLHHTLNPDRLSPARPWL
jgi:hypothetical protein